MENRCFSYVGVTYLVSGGHVDKSQLSMDSQQRNLENKNEFKNLGFWIPV